MKDEAGVWFEYAEENLESAKILVRSSLYNPCLQNVQQSIEKFLKALFAELSLSIIKTHSILKLRNILIEKSVRIDLTEDECDLLDTIYLPSKYPLGSVLPDFNPDQDICMECIEIADHLNKSVKKILMDK